jgi:hypothetical protein
VFRQEQKPQSAEQRETGKVSRAAPPRAFAKTRRGDPINLDTAPPLSCGKSCAWAIVRAPTGNDGYLMASLNQFKSNFGQVLTRRHDVGVKGLIEEKELHQEKQKFGKLKGEIRKISV